MKRLTLLLLGLALGVASTASAQGLTMQMSNGWSFSFSGNVNAFWVFTKGTNSGPTNSSVRTGLLPAFATFSASGKEAGLNLGVHFGFAPQINNAGVHDQFGAQIDMRQVYLTIGFKDGSQILAGRELGVFSRQNILNDMTLFGVGAVGIAAPGLGAGAQGGGTTLGRIGYGYLYPNFVPQVTYSTKPGQAQLSIGLFQPSIFGQGTGTNAASAAYVFTSIPRVEAEVTYNQKSGRNSYLLWAGGLWQTTKNAVTGGNSATSFVDVLGPRGGAERYGPSKVRRRLRAAHVQGRTQDQPGRKLGLQPVEECQRGRNGCERRQQQRSHAVEPGHGRYLPSVDQVSEAGIRG